MGSGIATQTTLQRSRDRLFRSLIENAYDIITILSSEGTILYESPSVERTLGFAPGELVGRNSFEFVHPDDVAAVQVAFLDVIANKMTGQGVEFRFRHKNGAWRYLELTGTNLLQDAVVEGIVVNSRDVTERKLAEQALRASEERYALAMRGANDGLWDWDLRTNRIYFSSRWKSMLGWADHEISDSPEEWLQKIHPDDKERFRLVLDAHLKGKTPNFESEYRIQHKDGAYRFMLSRGFATRDQQETALRIAGSQSDITDRKRVEEQLVQGALHDSLTGLPNRALLLDRLNRAIGRVRRGKGHQFAVLFLDLDRFKVVNDSLGHNAGDQLLIEVSRILEKCARAQDTVARLGGDEFVVLADDLRDRWQAYAIAQSIHDQLGAAFNINGHKVFMTASIGITFNSTDRDDAAEFIRDSDIAMYRAKALGKARSETFDASMHAGVLAQLKLETDLRHAIENNEFESWYQPIVEVATGRIVGFESLARWRSSKRGIVAPNEFIPMAEETGLIVPIGMTMLHEACWQLHCWDSVFPGAKLYVSVNISGRQLTQTGMVQKVKDILAQTNLEPSRLRLEITESVFMSDFEQAERILKPLQEFGIKICLDDFGTGYSSLSYLRRLPIDVLKIDRSFISGIERCPKQKALVQTMIHLAQALEIEVVAEGLETRKQLEHVFHLQCSKAQGFLYSRPVEAKVATQLIADQNLGRFQVWAANNTQDSDGAFSFPVEAVEQTWLAES